MVLVLIGMQNIRPVLKQQRRHARHQTLPVRAID
jgi:hypothetical protein